MAMMKKELGEEMERNRAEIGNDFEEVLAAFAEARLTARAVAYMCDACGGALEAEEDEGKVTVTLCHPCASAHLQEGIDEGRLQAAELQQERDDAIAAVEELGELAAQRQGRLSIRGHQLRTMARRLKRAFRFLAGVRGDLRAARYRIRELEAGLPIIVDDPVEAVEAIAAHGSVFVAVERAATAPQGVFSTRAAFECCKAKYPSWRDGVWCAEMRIHGPGPEIECSDCGRFFHPQDVRDGVCSACTVAVGDRLRDGVLGLLGEWYETPEEERGSCGVIIDDPLGPLEESESRGERVAQAIDRWAKRRGRVLDDPREQGDETCDKEELRSWMEEWSERTERNDPTVVVRSFPVTEEQKTAREMPMIATFRPPPEHLPMRRVKEADFRAQYQQSPRPPCDGELKDCPHRWERCAETCRDAIRDHEEP